MKVVYLNTWHSALHEELREYVTQQRYSTAVFCFQESTESERRLYEDLLEDEFTAYGVEQQGRVEDVSYGNVIYVRKEFQITEAGIVVSDSEDERELGLVTYVTLDHQGTTLTICNAHGVPRPVHKLDTPARLHQSQLILDFIAGRGPVIVGGDFNLLPEAESIKTFAAHGLRNLIADYEVPTTRNRIVFEKYPDSIQYYADYVFASPDVEVEDFAVPSMVVSDHQPLELRFSVQVSSKTTSTRKASAVV